MSKEESVPEVGGCGDWGETDVCEALVKSRLLR